MELIPLAERELSRLMNNISVRAKIYYIFGPGLAPLKYDPSNP